MLTDVAKDVLRPLIPEALLRARRELPMKRLARAEHASLAPKDLRSMVTRVLEAHAGIECAHTHAEMATMLKVLLSLDDAIPGCIVEAGCFKGGSTAKLSIAAGLMGRRLVVFDSFEGIPENTEGRIATIHGYNVSFAKGEYCGRLEEVKDNVRRYGDLSVCEFVKGWFENTMPSFGEPIAMAFIDVDLESSTRTCLQYLYPLLSKGGSLFSHDGHLSQCIRVFQDDEFWSKTVGYPRPSIAGIGKVKLLQIVKR